MRSSKLAVKRGRRLDAYILLNEDKFLKGFVLDDINKRGLATKPARKEIDLVLVRDLASIGCTYSEMAMVLGCSEKWIVEQKQNNPAFAIALEEGEGEIKQSLRRAQLDEAINGRNASLLIWLGKQYLGQTDKQDINTTKTISITVQKAADELRGVPKAQILAALDMLNMPVIEGNKETPADEDDEG